MGKTALVPRLTALLAAAAAGAIALSGTPQHRRPVTRTDRSAVPGDLAKAFKTAAASTTYRARCSSASATPSPTSTAMTASRARTTATA